MNMAAPTRAVLILALILISAPSALLAGEPAKAGPAAVQVPLKDFIERVWRENPAVQAAEAGMAAAQAQGVAAEQPLYNPAVEVDIEDAETKAGFLGLSQQFDWSGKRGARTRIGQADLGVARSALESVRQRVAVEVLDALARYHAARNLRVLAGQRVTLMRRFADLARRRQLAGDIGQLDLELAQLALTEAILQESTAASVLVKTERDIRRIAGVSSQAWPAFPSDPPPPPFAAGETEKIIAQIPEIQRLRGVMEAARRRIDMARLNRNPDPTISLRAGREQTDKLIGLNLSIPLFVRNTFQAEVDVAARKAVRAEKIQRDAVQRARADIDEALARYALNRDTWDIWRAMGRPSVAERLRLLDRMWQAGELSASEYLVQLNQGLNTEVAGTVLSRELWQSWVALLSAAGQVDEWLGV